MVWSAVRVNKNEKGVSEIYRDFLKNTNELSISIPGQIAKPMIIEGNTFVFVDEFEILHHKKMRIYQMSQFASVSSRQIMHQGTSIFKEYSRIDDACLHTYYVQ